MSVRIIATGTAFPRFEYDQATVKARLVRWLEESGERGHTALATLDTNLVERRALVVPIEDVFADRSFAERNDAYVRHALDLGAQAIVTCLARAGLGARDVDHFISTSCTGFAIPSLDALLAHRLGMKPALSRLPITEHGCAAGAVALVQAATHLAARPDHRVLVLSVELASLTFLKDDLSPENVVSAGLFADGAAAALVSGEARAGRPAVTAWGSRMFPDSEELMGFRLVDAGLKIVLSREVPDAIRVHAVPAITEFLESRGTPPSRVDHWLLHPGGRKIIETFEDAFQLGRGGLELSRRALRTRGNLSSATVICMLDDFFDQGLGEPGDVGFLAAFGPGFGVEMALLAF
jgi:alkylresorcinol/alkylpyrone synthase